MVQLPDQPEEYRTINNQLHIYLLMGQQMRLYWLASMCDCGCVSVQQGIPGADSIVPAKLE